MAFKTGWAAYEAGQDIRRQLVQRAALLWETEAENVEYVDGALQHKSDSELRMTFKEIAPRLNDTGGPVVGRGNVNPRGAGGSFTATLVDVEVDPETGKTQALRCTVIQDAGKAIHPSYVEGQMQGGTVQGIGWALNEEYVMSDKGELLNSSLLDYRMMTSLDLPMIDTVIVEVANPGHPYGIRGVVGGVDSAADGGGSQRRPSRHGGEGGRAAYISRGFAGGAGGVRAGHAPHPSVFPAEAGSRKGHGPGTSLMARASGFRLSPEWGVTG